MRPLRVAYLVASLRAGGAEKQMLALAEGLPRDRFQVDFVSIAGAGEYDARAVAAGAHIRALGGPPAPGAGLPARLARRGRKAVRYAQVARAARYDIVDAWLYPADILAAFARPFTGMPIVVAGRRNLGDVDGRLSVIHRAIGSAAIRLIDAVVANSDAVASEALARERIDPAKLRVIRNGVGLIAPISADDRVSRRRELGAVADDVLIGCIANYRPVKRLDLLIEAFATVAQDDRRLRLVLVGDGPLRAQLASQIAGLGLEGRVRLNGTDLDPRRLYGAFDLIVQSSRSEGLPNAMLEAAAAGRPIVATAAGGTSEIVIDDVTGLLVPINDATALATAIRRAVGDESLRSRIAAAAQVHVATTFGMDRYVAEFAALYESLAAARRVRR